MEDLSQVTYCGLYCGLCSQRCRIPPQASALQGSMAKEGYEYWAKDIPGFQEFWEFLQSLSEQNTACPGCRDGGGPPFCGIRKCALVRGVRLCPECSAYPCRHVKALGEGYPMLLADGERIRRIGLDKWVHEQQERARNGFCYADVRCEPCEIPDE